MVWWLWGIFGLYVWNCTHNNKHFMPYMNVIVQNASPKKRYQNNLNPSVQCMITTTISKLCITDPCEGNQRHYDDVIMTMLASQITSLTVVYSIVYSGVNQRKHQSSASLAFVREIHRGPVNFPHKWPVTRKMFPFDDVIMGEQRTSNADAVSMWWCWCKYLKYHIISHWVHEDFYTWIHELNSQQNSQIQSM